MSGIPLVAIRHAPTLWNAERRLQGRTDVPLGAEGEAAARSWHIDPAWRDYRVISSPLARAAATARLLFPDREIAIDARLIEMSFGGWEGKSLAELRGSSGSDAESRERMGLDFRAPGGESPREVQARVAPLLAEIAEPTIIVTHKAVLRALLSLGTGWEMRDKPPVKLLPSTAHVFALGSGGEITIERMNVSLLPGDTVDPHPGPLPVGKREGGSVSFVPRMRPPQRTVAADRNARALRRRMTEAEKRLWTSLRGRRLAGYKFVRQVPLGNYIADFVCRYPKLVIECDGGQHDWRAHHDEHRTQWLEAQGYRVLRFWNNDVLRNTSGVLDHILEVLQQLERGAGSHRTTPSPQRGEGRGEGQT
jgi:probable phosphoglycerate mutase